MKDLQQYKDAVLKRAEEKRREQQRARRRTLALCVPLCVCAVIVGLFVFPPTFPVSEDSVAPEIGDTDIVGGTQTEITPKDPDGMYNALMALFLYDTEYGGVTDNGWIDESYFEDSEAPEDGLAESTAYSLRFERENGVHEFRLEGNELTDLVSGNTITLTDDQVNALLNGDTPSTDVYGNYITASLSAVQWFPCRDGFENDDFWGVQTNAYYDGIPFYQRFTERVEDTGYTNLLDTAYDRNGSLTITRNETEGADKAAVQTLSIEAAPAFEFDSGNVLHFDFEASDGWSIALTFRDIQTIYVYDTPSRRTVSVSYTVTLDSAILQACDTSDDGRFTGTLDLYAALQALANEGDEAAAAALSLKTVRVPQWTFTCVGGEGSSLTMHKWLYSAPDDENGDDCVFACLDVMLGEYT